MLNIYTDGMQLKNSYITKKIPYIRMLIRIKIVELSKQPLPIVYGRKEIN